MSKDISCETAHTGKKISPDCLPVIPSGGIHALAYRGAEIVGHAVATARWLQPAGQRPLRTADIDAVATLQRQGIGSMLMHRLATAIADFEISCLETSRVSFHRGVG